MSARGDFISCAVEGHYDSWVSRLLRVSVGVGYLGTVLDIL